MRSTTSLSDSRCWTLSVEITVIPASSSSSTSCQRFSFRDPGTFVWASSSTSATCGRRARTASTSISSKRRAPVLDRAARDDLQVADLLRVCCAAVGLDDADDDVGRRGRGVDVPRRASRTSCRRPAPRRGRCGACRGPWRKWTRIRRPASSARLSARTFTRGSPMNPSVRSCVFSSTSSSTRSSSSPRDRATRGAWSLALAGEMSGSSPEPDAVTASTGMVASSSRPLSSR